MTRLLIIFVVSIFQLPHLHALEHRCSDQVREVKPFIVDPREALRLLKAYRSAKPGPKKELHKKALITYLYPLAQFVGRRYAKKRNLKESEDFVQDASLGIIKAIDSFDPSKGEIIPYLAKRAFGVLVDKQRGADWVPRLVRERKRIIEGLRQLYAQSYAPTDPFAPSFEDFVKNQISDPQLATRVLHDGVTIPLVFGETAQSDLDRPLDFLVARDDGFESQLNSLREDLWKALARGFSERDTFIFEMYFRYRQPVEEIGRILGLSPTRIHQRLTHIKEFLKVRFADSPNLKLDLQELSTIFD